MRKLVRIGLAASVLAAATSPVATAWDDGDEPLPIHPTGRVEAQDWIVEGSHHAFGILQGAPAAGVEAMLPPGFTLASCLEHKVPQSTPPAGTADIILEAWEITVAEHEEWGKVRVGAIATCVSFPEGLGYPEKDMAESGYQQPLGMPTAPHAFVLEGWTDSPEMKEFMEGFGLAPQVADITIEDIGPAAWTFELSDGEDAYGGTFVTAQRTPAGDTQFAPCVGVQQRGTYIEWPKGSDTFAVVEFLNAVTPDGLDVDANTYMCVGGEWHWNDAMADVLGPQRPPALVGSQPNDVGSANREIFHRYRAGDGAAGVESD